MTIDEHFFPDSEINLPLPSRRKRRAPNWRQSPRVNPQVDPGGISQLLAERQWAYRIADIDPTPANRADAQAASTALTEGQWRAATEFGVPHCWRPARRCFMLEDLAGLRNSKRRFRHLDMPREFFDHAWCFRWMHNHQPAGIVAQPYKAAFDLAEAQEFARENELEVSVADLFESWHNPGMCTLVVWRRGGPGTNGVGGNCWMTPA